MTEKHTFKFGNKSNPKLCLECGQDLLSHLTKNKCDDCNAITQLSYYEKLNKHLCLACRGKETEKVLQIKREEEELNRTVREEATNILHNGNNSLAPAIGILAQDEQDTQTIRYNGDLFNAKTVAIIELKKFIDTDESIPVNEKNLAFQRALLARMKHYKEVVFKLNDELLDANTGVLAIEKTLRDLGKEYSAEIQAEIRALDMQYQPERPKVVKVKIKKEKKSATEVMIETLMTAKGISEDAAKELLRMGGLL